MTACSAHVFTCSNSYGSFSSISTGVTIHSGHLTQLRTAINGAYTRIGLPAPSWTYTPAGGETTTIHNLHYNEMKNRINYISALAAMYGYNLVTSVFSTGGLITSGQTVELQNDTNNIRNRCYCNYNCTCDAECTCDGDCGCDYS